MHYFRSHCDEFNTSDCSYTYCNCFNESRHCSKGWKTYSDHKQLTNFQSKLCAGWTSSSHMSLQSLIERTALFKRCLILLNKKIKTFWLHFPKMFKPLYPLKTCWCDINTTTPQWHLNMSLTPKVWPYICAKTPNFTQVYWWFVPYLLLVGQLTATQS